MPGSTKTHRLTVQEMPSHSHGLVDYSAIDYDNDGVMVVALKNDRIQYDEILSKDGYLMDTGGSQAHNNMPPYWVVNIWKRTA